MASYIQAARGMVTVTVGGVRAGVAGAVSTAASLRAFATSSIESIKQNGMRTWSAELARALRIAAGAQAKMLQVTARRLLIDAGEKTRQGAWIARGKTIALAKAAKHVASQKSFQATAGSAVGGAIAMGTGGGATGLAAGGAIGAAVGVPFALFTFGLSIPIGAVIGGGTGLVTGAAVGATTGAVGGGAVGYGAYTKSDEIKCAAKYAQGKASEGATLVQRKTSEGAKYAQGKASEGATFVQRKTSEGASFMKVKASEGAVQLKGAAFQSAEYASGMASAAKSRVMGA